MNRIVQFALVLFLMAAAPDAFPQYARTWPPPPDPAEVQLEWGVPVQLRGGEKALVSVYRPAEHPDPLPTIFMMTPYMADAFHSTAKYFAQRGYVTVLADTPGRGNTDGEWKPFINDGPVGYDIVEWIARQPWSDGQVAMAGISYLGFTQWTTLKEFPPHLVTIVPTAPAYFSYTTLRPYNIFSTYAIRWLTGVSGRVLSGQLVADTDYWDETFLRWYRAHLPYAELARMAGNETTELSTWIEHPVLDDYVDGTAVSVKDYPRIEMPVLSITGYFDGEQRATMRHYHRHMQYGNDKAKARHYLIMGPWDHVATFWPRSEIEGLTFEKGSVLDMGTLHTEWYDWILKDRSRPEFLKNRVAYYLMGAEEWRYADSIDAVTSGSRVFYLDSSDDNPGDLSHAGALDSGPASGTSTDKWAYDPLDTRPGEFELETEETYVSPADSLDLFGAGLVYETPALGEPLDIAGYIRLNLWLSMDVPDTDFHATLYEVTASGDAIYLTRQLQRARFRDSLEYERLVTPGEVTSFVLDDFDFFARRIATGSRIRLVVGALNSPRFEKNYNSGGVVAMESGKDARTANVNLYHGQDYPSALELPIAARSHVSD